MIEKGCGAASKVLLVEDNVLLAMTIEEELETAGFTLVGPAASNAQALACLRRAAPDIAVLDVELLDGPSFATALELRRRQVPFLVSSGCVGAWSEYAGAPWLCKPHSPGALVRTLRGILASAGEFRSAFARALP